jgi:hypothetical protein
MELDQDHQIQSARRRGAAIEENLRAAAFLPFNEKICGIEVVPLTLRILGRLRASKSPFLCGGEIRPGHIVAFLWAISPDYNPGVKAPDSLVEKAGALPYQRARRAIRKYLFLAWMDRPPVRRNAKGDLAAVSFEAAMIHHIATAYGWDDETILDKPLKRLYQYLTMVRLESNPKAVTFNPIVDRLVRRLRKS